MPPFRPRFPWWGGDLQTLASRFIGPVPQGPHASERLAIPLDDGTGDTLLATLDRDGRIDDRYRHYPVQLWTLGSGGPRWIFLGGVAVFPACHLAWFTVVQGPLWTAFAAWFRSLPLT